MGTREHPERHRTTLADVAARAGVSRATASRALADDDRISSATQAAVRDAAEMLDYVPNVAARSLRARRTRALGLLLPELSDPVHAQVAAGFEREAADAGYTVVIVTAGSDIEAERRALTVFVERAMDGICIASSTLDPEDVMDRVGQTLPAFIQPNHDGVVSNPEGLADGTIRSDDASGIRQAVRHLLSLGHRDVAYVGSGDRATNQLRRAAAGQALQEEAGRELRTFQVAADAWTTPREIAQIVVRDLPEAVVCYDDKTALALLDGLRTYGLRVPGDLALVGFDGIPFAALSNPRLTTVATPAVEMGRLAAGSLVAAAGSGHLPQPRILPVELIVRESSGYPAHRGKAIDDRLLTSGTASRHG